MRKNSAIIIASSAVGISLLSILVLIYPPTINLGESIINPEKTSSEIFWEDYTKNNPDVILVNPVKEPSSSWSHSFWDNSNPTLRLIGLHDQYQKDEAIEFDVKIYGDGSGCGQGTILILNENEIPPTLFSQEYVGKCKYHVQNDLAIPIHFEINTPIGQIPNLGPGKYVAHASYWQHRSSYGEIKQEFVITDYVVQDGSPKIKITVNDNIPKRKIVPISVYQISTPKNNEITFWGFSVLGIEMSSLGKRWGNLPNPSEFTVFDKNGNDVLDRSKLDDGMFYFPLSLVYYPATCDDGGKISAEAILPTKVPVNSTGQVSAGSTTLGLYPNEDGIYYLEFASPFEIDLELGKNIKPYAHEQSQCTLDNPKDGFESLYHLKFWFEAEDQK